MELKSERLLLRPLGMQYLESVHEYASDLENTKYMVYLPNAALEETVAFFQNLEKEMEKRTARFL